MTEQTTTTTTAADAPAAATTQAPLIGGDTQPAPEPEIAAADRRSEYMVLWAPMPDKAPEDLEATGELVLLHWRELGWQRGHDTEQAKQQAVADVRREPTLGREDTSPNPQRAFEPDPGHPQREAFEAALRGRGLKLRAVAKRSWPDQDAIDLTELYTPPAELRIG